MKLFIKVCGKGNLLEEKNDLLAMRMFFGLNSNVIIFLCFLALSLSSFFTK